MRLLYFVFLLSSGLSLRAQHLLTGIVSDGQGPIPGATVRLLGTSYGVVTQVDGSFQLEVNEPGEYTLEVRSVGFKPEGREIKVPSHHLSITLTETLLTMDEVVVTATMRPTFVSQSPIKTDIITANYLNTFMPAAATGVMEGIGLINGVQEQVACGVCFTNSISINGLPGPYTAVLMDGTPMFGNLASVYGLNGIPSMIIDRIEVIKGPSSTLYGSEAVAGVINIITRSPDTQPTLAIDVMGTSHFETFGNLVTSQKIGKHRSMIGVNYAYMDNFDDDNEDGFSDLIHLDRVAIFNKWQLYRPSSKAFSLAAKYYYEDRRNGVESYLTNRNYRTLRGDDSVYGESIYTHRIEVFGNYEFNLPAVQMDYSLSTHRQDSYYGADRYQAEQDILFTNLRWSPTLGKHRLMTGLTQRIQRYDDNTVATAQQADVQYIPGLFIQDEWEIAPRFTLLSGTRLDHYHEHGWIVSPRMSTRYKPGEWTTFRTNFGTGFRVVNLFTEDHAFVTGQREVVIAENLQPEKSLNVSININHLYTTQRGQGMVDIDAFYTHFTNKITPDYEQDPNQIVYDNVDGFAVSRGLGMNIQHEFGSPVSISIGMTVQEVHEVENGRKSKILLAPLWSGVSTVGWRMAKQRLSVSYSANFTGPMHLPEVFDLDGNGDPLPASRPTRSSPFGIHNLQVTKEFSRQWSVYGGIQNLFDYRQPWSPLVAYNDPQTNPGFSPLFDTAYAYSPIHGREFYLGVKWQPISRN